MACKASIGADMDAIPEAMIAANDAPMIDLAIPLGPWLSPDGRTMLFTSNRDGTQRIWQGTR